MTNPTPLQFGPFILDEAARVLRLHDRHIALQPRVFDLLAYLVRRRERVVSKDELLDAVWPGVTVTDNSLQRAVSLLRSALREGGMEGAVRNIPRSGYRFLGDAEPVTPQLAVGTERQIALATQAVQEKQWHRAADQYEIANRHHSLGGEDFDNWAASLHCLGRPSDAAPILVRAVAAHSSRQDAGRAASSAVFLSTIHLERNEIAVAKGWLTRAAELVADQPAAAANGQIIWMDARIAASEGNPLHALDRANEAYEFGKCHGNIEVEALGLMYRGFFKLSLGDTEAGLADQDHAAALALSHGIDVITNGILYCNILWACRTFGDWSRANQWTLGYQSICSEGGMEFSGSCQLHRAEVLAVQGSLPDALRHIREALGKLSGDAPWALGDAHRVLGDIESAIGNRVAARTAYEKSYALGWNPEPGLAMLLLEEGDAEAAFASLERSLIGQSWWTLQRQGILLAHLALVAAYAGRREKAMALVADLAAQDSRWPTPSIRALTAEASAVLAKQDDPHAALRHLHLARQLWTSIDSRFHAARLRLEIAELQLATADPSGAQNELRAAIDAANEQKSDKLIARGKALLRKVA